ncbi:MAG: ATP-binding protein [Acidimicrobiales bacterium]
MTATTDRPMFTAPEPADVLVVSRDPAEVAKARHWLAQLLVSHGVGPPRCEDAVLMVSELVTNGMRHGHGAVVLRASVSGDGTVMLAVNDAGDHTDSAGPQKQEVDLRRVGGMGLRIVESISTNWGVVRYPGGTTVWVVLAGDHANRGGPGGAYDQAHGI